MKVSKEQLKEYRFHAPMSGFSLDCNETLDLLDDIEALERAESYAKLCADTVITENKKLVDLLDQMECAMSHALELGYCGKGSTKSMFKDALKAYDSYNGVKNERR